MIAELLFVAIAVAGTLFITRRWPDVARRLYRGYKSARNVILAILGAVTAAVFLGSGVGYLVFIGMLSVGVFVLTIMYDEPHKQVKQWIQ